MPPAALLSRLGALSARTRTIASIAGACAIVAIVLFASQSHDARVALFATPLQPEQRAEVEERLASWNAGYVASADNVFVSANARNALLLKLSLAGVPHPHLENSTDALAKVGALTPQSVIDAQARTGLQSDVALALRGISGVEDAGVIIAPAKAAVFADEAATHASASVRLRLQPAARLKAAQIAGIRRFVAAAVPGLDEGRVTIVDDRGVALGDDTATVDQSDVQQSVQSALDGAFGAGATIVRVAVATDPRTQAVRDVRRAAPGSTTLTSERTEESYAANDRRYHKATQNDDRGSETRETDVLAPAGRVARLSIAVAVDASHSADLYKIRTLAAAAAGLDERRGDTIAVAAVAFHHALEPRRDGWNAAYGALLAAIPTLSLGCIVLLALRISARPVALLVRSAVARASLVHTRRAVTGFAPAQVIGALRGEPPHTAAAVISALPAATAAAVLDFYPPEERAAIVRRMARAHSPLMPDYETIVARG